MTETITPETASTAAEQPMLRIIGVDTAGSLATPDHIVLQAIAEDQQIVRFRVDLPTIEPLRILREMGANTLLMHCREQGRGEGAAKFFAPTSTLWMVSARADATDNGDVVFRLTAKAEGGGMLTPPGTFVIMADVDMAERASVELAGAARLLRDRKRQAN